jgi:fucokinase
MLAAIEASRSRAAHPLRRSEYSMQQVDWLVLTAANRAQARGYRAELNERTSSGSLHGCERILVVPDAGGRRIGSGGSTLFVLYRLAVHMLRQGRRVGRLADLFANQNIMIVHCGGDSRRLVPYSAQGKVFLPLPIETSQAAPVSMFDLILQDLRSLVMPPDGRVVIAAGDVFLDAGRHEIPLHEPGLTGVAYPDDQDRASRHGVYVVDDDDRVVDFLQKPSADEALRRGALRADGSLLVDTGLVSFDAATAEAWLRCAGIELRDDQIVRGPGPLDDVIGGRLELDLYTHMLPSIAPARSGQSWMADVPFRAVTIPECPFLHLGTTRELIDGVRPGGPIAQRHGFVDRTCAFSEVSSDVTVSIHSSVVGGRVSCTGPDVLIEACDLRGVVRLAGRNVLVGVPESATHPIGLPEGWSLVCLPLPGDLWSVVVVGDRDDGKTSVNQGGTFGNEPLHRLVDRLDRSEAALWPDSCADDDRTLWNAQFWPVGPVNAALGAIEWLTAPDAEPSDGWHALRRASLADLIPMVDNRAAVAQRAHIRREVRQLTLRERLLHDRFLPAHLVLDDIDALERNLNDVESTALVHRTADVLADVIRQTSDPAMLARLSKLQAMLGERYGDALSDRIDPVLAEQAAFAAVAEAVRYDEPMPRSPASIAIEAGQRVVASAPIRIDFAGGWSDTPPICNEHGGAVVNGAIRLDGKAPVRATAVRLDEPVLRVRSADLGRATLINSPVTLDSLRNPEDWAALPKACLALAGLCPTEPGADVADWLARAGGGVELTVDGGVPKGSGLGTSSVLSAVALACLGRMTDAGWDHRQIIFRTSILEQLMGAGGGWQDQSGGIHPGVKLVWTDPGHVQIPRVESITLGPDIRAAFQRRCILYFTGLQRRARNILEKVVGRHLARDPEAVHIIDDLTRGARRMQRDLACGDFDAFARGVLEYWSLKCRLDPGSTNEAIEAMLDAVRPLLAGYGLAGAGGGGFIFMVARDERSAGEVRRRLDDLQPNAAARRYAMAIDDEGLIVEVR